MGITGTLAEGYWTAPWTLVTSTLNGTTTWSSNLQTTGCTTTLNTNFKNSESLPSNRPAIFYNGTSTSNGTLLIIRRLNQSISLTNYNYIDFNNQSSLKYKNASYITYFGVSTNANLTSVSLSAQSSRSTGESTSVPQQINRVNVSSLSGNYYIYFIMKGTFSSGNGYLWSFWILDITLKTV